MSEGLVLVMDIKTVLIVDDDPTIRTIVEISLSRVGKWNVVKADSGAKALELISLHKPDLILLDVMMPAMDGPTTFSKIREMESFAAIPVIFLTAKVQRQEVQNYCRLGAAGVISKPFDPISLPGEISRILGPIVGTACIA